MSVIVVCFRKLTLNDPLHLFHHRTMTPTTLIPPKGATILKATFLHHRQSCLFIYVGPDWIFFFFLERQKNIFFSINITYKIYKQIKHMKYMFTKFWKRIFDDTRGGNPNNWFSATIRLEILILSLNSHLFCLIYLTIKHFNNYTGINQWYQSSWSDLFRIFCLHVFQWKDRGH